MRLMIFLCRPIFFITSNSETKSANSTSVASSVGKIKEIYRDENYETCSGWLTRCIIPFKVFTATVRRIEPRRGTYASALSTRPKAPSPIVPRSRTFSRLISQSSSYGISLVWKKKMEDGSKKMEDVSKEMEDVSYEEEAAKKCHF